MGTLKNLKMKLSFALIALASANPLAPASACEEKCSDYSMSVYKKCMDKDGANKDDCTKASKKAYSECEGKCDGKSSRKDQCGSKCKDYSMGVYKKCMDKEGATGKAYKECAAKCEKKPTTCSDKCTDYSWSIYK